MKQDCILFLLMCSPLVQPAHETTHGSTKGDMISLPWETHRHDKSVQAEQPSLGDNTNNRMIHNSIPLTNPSLGETIAAVSPSEVRTLSDNTDVSQGTFDPQFDFPRRHWRRRPPFWRRRFFRPDTMPDLMPEIPRSNHGRDTTTPQVQSQRDGGLHTDKRTPQASQNQKLISSILPGLEIGSPDSKQNDKLSVNHKTDSFMNQPKLKEKSGSDQKKISGGQTTGLLKGLLQKITEKVASNIVDKLVDKVLQNNQIQSAVSPGNTPSVSHALGRGFSSPLISHVHGANGEVIPIVHHGDHVHTPHGQTIALNNPMRHTFGRIGHRNSWNQNPFLHRAVQNSQRGWVHG